MRLIYTDRKLNVILTSRLLQSRKARLVGIVDVPAKYNGRNPRESRLSSDERNAVLKWEDGKIITVNVQRLNLSTHE
jgi:hypothetical protein